MAKIVAVHGVGQQFKGDAVLHREWWPAFLSGLHLAGHDLSDARDFVCPFYGHVFRKPRTLSTSDDYKVEDVTDEEAKLLALFWRAASEAEPSAVSSPAAYESGEALARTPHFVQRALNALSRSRFWANVSQSLLVGDVKQTFRYLNDLDLRENVLQIVGDRITSDTRVVIGHSLGSVVAYEALCRRSEGVASFISLGSPLGIRNVIFEKIRPTPTALGGGVWPGQIKHWTNIADKGDIVAIQKQLAPLFPGNVRDVLVFNGSDAHHGERYLTSQECGSAAGEGLWQGNS